MFGTNALEQHVSSYMKFQHIYISSSWNVKL